MTEKKSMQFSLKGSPKPHKLSLFLCKEKIVFESVQVNKKWLINDFQNQSCFISSKLKNIQNTTLIEWGNWYIFIIIWHLLRWIQFFICKYSYSERPEWSRLYFAFIFRVDCIWCYLAGRILNKEEQKPCICIDNVSGAIWMWKILLNMFYKGFVKRKKKNHL